MPATFELPRLRHVARHAWPRLLEATLIPLALFYAAMWMLGLWGALGASLLWSYSAIARRLVRHKPVPGVLVMGAAATTVRTAIAIASGSVFVYFLQPTLSTLVVGAAFLISVPAGKPLAQKLVADFCPMPEALANHPRVQTFFTRITLLWAFVQVVNATITVWLLMSQPVSVYLMAKTLVSWALSLGTVAACTVWFVRSMRRHGLLPA
ncbi:MAG: DUF3159 domain-containing protein [Actinobacteria bacterium]|nr:DUF3159 domain-containing protein [Actinomycetota bacterium]MBV8957380.1 DUF3159 domain-containing protein [Actinomycetota bacterium]MBV9253471.1 DUF3159 domain-containing protein [Actinomycetota bacterium]MBV9664601.1 DUF3159 domain-containing protein [Actinomycetota bacterium]MBV9933888.1 DUF3159 domain-containing protein [Actinomycetota bacterium]